MSELLTSTTPVNGGARSIRAHRAAPGVGIADIQFPTALLARDMAGIRRMTLMIWARLNAKEDQRDSAKRVSRYLDRDLIPRPGAGDFPLEPVDLVLTVAGMIWPGLERWRQVRSSLEGQDLMIDWWWGHWGQTPGAVVLRDGVLHLIHMDRDTDAAMKSQWMRWAAKWGGPVLHHAIQVLGEDPAGEQSVILNRLGKKGGRSGCMIWPSTAGLDLRPWRADLAGTEVVLRSVGEGVRLATTPGVPLSVWSEMKQIEGFSAWMDSLEIPKEARVSTPLSMHLELEIQASSGLGKSWAKKKPETQAGLTPLFEEAVEAPVGPMSPVEKEFGIKLGPDVAPERIAAMLSTAKSELVRHTLTHNRAKADYWREITTALEPWFAPGSAK